MNRIPIDKDQLDRMAMLITRSHGSRGFYVDTCRGRYQLQADGENVLNHPYTNMTELGYMMKAYFLGMNMKGKDHAQSN